MIVFLAILAYVAFVNWGTYRAFAKDKQYAIDKAQRTPEKTLLKWVAMGGWAGAKYAQSKLRHKSYKQPFGRHLNEIGAIQTMIIGLLLLTYSFLALSPVSSSNTPNAPTAKFAAPDTQPDPVPPLISLRPPAAYRSGL